MTDQFIILFFLFASCITSLIFGAIGMYCGIQAYVRIKAFEKSTHTVQFTPLTTEEAVMAEQDKQVNIQAENDYFEAMRKANYEGLEYDQTMRL